MDKAAPPAYEGREVGGMSNSSRGYKVKLDSGQTLIVEVNDRGWTVKIKGDGWKPGIHARDPIWEDNKKWDTLQETFCIDKDAWNAFRESVEQQEAEATKPKADSKSQAEEIPEDIKEKAQAIATRGDPFKFLVWQAQRNHLGDVDMHKVLISSIASASSETSHGLQPGNNGDSGSGKDDACEAVYLLVPSDRKLDGSLSPMSLFYLEKDGLLKPGMVLYSDDVEYLPIIPIYKRSSARFQKFTNHYSVSSGKERTGLKMTIPPRMVWWMTSVESVANLEAFGRQYPISTDSSPGHKKRVTEEIAARRARTELKLTEDEGIEVARAIIADIFDNGPFKVLIPQATKAKWLKVSDFRGQEQFWDLADAQVVLRWRQRKKDENGWLIAEDQDLAEAKEIHTGHKVAHFSDLTEAEAKVVGVMSSGRPMTQKELTEALEIAQSTLSIRLKSIMAKSAIITEDYDQGKKVYSINPKMNLGTDYWNGLNLIELGIDDSKTYCSQLMPLLQSYCSVIGVPIGVIINNSNRIPSSLLLNMTESMRDFCSRCCGRSPSDENNYSSYVSAKTSNNDQNEQQEDLLHYNKQGNNGQSDYNKDIIEPIDTTIRQAGDTEEQTKAQMEHFRKVAEDHAGRKPLLICAKCGEDLTGKGTVERNGKVYCAVVGCGYPARREAQAT